MDGQIVFLAHVVTDVLNEGFLPAAKELGLQTVIVTDQASLHRQHFAQAGLSAYPDDILGCDVFNPLAVIETVQEANLQPAAIFSHSDHLQTSTALAAEHFGLPGKDWRVCYRANNKAAMRAYLAEQGDAPLWYRLITDQDALNRLLDDCPYPCVAKPREGVASKDVALVHSAEKLQSYCRDLWQKQPHQPLLIEEYLEGPLCTLETLGDGQTLQVLGGFRVELSEPPHFVELSASWDLELEDETVEQVKSMIERFGVGFGSCHTEFVMTQQGPRLIEINYRTIGDGREFLLQEALDLPLFKQVLQLHLGQPLPALAVPDRQLLIQYVCATESGRLLNVPQAFRETVEVNGAQDGFVAFKPLRQSGERLQLSHSNKDYLGVIQAVGRSLEGLREQVAAIRQGLQWEVQA